MPRQFAAPGGGGALSHVEVDDATSMMKQDNEYVEHPKGRGRHDEEVDRDEICHGETSKSRTHGSPAGASESRLGPNGVQCPAPPGPTVGEPHPEGTIEAPELWSLGSAAKQGELLPERQVLENEVGAGSERRA